MAYQTRGTMGGLFGCPATKTCERFQVPGSDVAFHLMMTDITKLPVDCIVNAATNSLLGGGGVDGAIHRAAGAKLLRSCFMEPTERYGTRCETGDAVLTEGPFGKNLLATHIIHTVGPIVTRGSIQEGAAKLKECIVSTLSIAIKQQYKSIAFPAISCGIYNAVGNNWHSFAAHINVTTCKEMLSGTSLKHIIFAFTEEDVYEAWRDAVLKVLFSIPEPVSPRPANPLQSRLTSPPPSAAAAAPSKAQDPRLKEKKQKPAGKSGEKRKPSPAPRESEARKTDDTGSAAVDEENTVDIQRDMMIEAKKTEVGATGGSYRDALVKGGSVSSTSQVVPPTTTPSAGPTAHREGTTASTLREDEMKVGSPTLKQYGKRRSNTEEHSMSDAMYT